MKKWNLLIHRFQSEGKKLPLLDPSITRRPAVSKGCLNPSSKGMRDFSSKSPSVFPFVCEGSGGDSHRLEWYEANVSTVVYWYLTFGTRCMCLSSANGGTICHSLVACVYIHQAKTKYEFCTLSIQREKCNWFFPQLNTPSSTASKWSTQNALQSPKQSPSMSLSKSASSSARGIRICLLPPFFS